MDFRLSDEQQQIRQMVREFAEAEMRPHVMEWDEKQTFPKDVVKKLGELGMLGIIFPEEYGGAGLSYVDYVNVIEELGVVDSSVALTVAAHNSLCTGHIYLAGNDEQRKKWMPKLTTGDWIGAWGLTEPGSGSDAGFVSIAAMLVQCSALEFATTRAPGMACSKTRRFAQRAFRPTASAGRRRRSSRHRGRT